MLKEMPFHIIRCDIGTIQDRKVIIGSDIQYCGR